MRLLVVLAALIVAAVSCGGEDREAIATEAANEWVRGNTDVAADAIVDVLALHPALRLAMALPSARERLEGIVADQIRENISWTFSPPRPEGEVDYRVTATARLDVEIDLPVVDAQRAAVTLPFRLLIDTDTRRVQGSADVGAASVDRS